MSQPLSETYPVSRYGGREARRRRDERARDLRAAGYVVRCKKWDFGGLGYGQTFALEAWPPEPAPLRRIVLRPQPGLGVDPSPRVVLLERETETGWYGRPEANPLCPARVAQVRVDGGNAVSPCTLYFMDDRPRLEDGEQWSPHRCPTCPARPNLRAVIRDGAVVHAGCPLCRAEFPCEVVREANGQGRVLFFPPGTIVIG